MNDRKDQIKRAVSAVFTFLTGTKKEVREAAEEIAEDVEDQIQRRRRIGSAITVKDDDDR